MIDTPSLITTVEQHTAVIRLDIPREEMRNVMGPAITELLMVVRSQGLEPQGRWFTHHFSFNPKTFDFEVGMPVKTAVTPTGRVLPSKNPEVRVARTVYLGPYEGLAKAWPEVDAWVKAQGLTPAEELWETYLTDPSEGGDPATWRTELTRRLK